MVNPPLELLLDDELELDDELLELLPPLDPLLEEDEPPLQVPVQACCITPQ